MSAVELDQQARNWLQAYRDAAAQEKHWADVKAQAREHLEDRLGDNAEGKLDGVTVVRWTEVVSNRLDTAKLKTSEPDIYAAYLKPSISRRFTLADPRMTTFAQPETTPADSLKLEIQQVITQASANDPRSLQEAIGPSGVGAPCVRRLGYQLAGVPETNTTSDPWASISGKSLHTWLEAAFATDSDRWMTETKVQITQTLSGTVDLYDRKHHRVIDHKTCGATSMKKYKAEGPSHQQLVQINLYAYGLILAGHPVSEVALVYYPLGGRLSGMHTWVGPYDVALAHAALDRLDDIRALVVSLDADRDPARLSLLPTTANRLCAWCPWHLYKSTDLAVGCPGDSAPTDVSGHHLSAPPTPISNNNIKEHPMFDQPTSGTWLKPADHNGHLLLIESVASITKHYDDLKKAEVDKAEMTVVDLDDANPTRLTMLNSHPGIVNKLRKLAAGGNPVLGRITQVPSNYASPAWVLGEFVAGVDDVKAEAWVKANPATTFAQPASPTPPPASAQPSGPNTPTVAVKLPDGSVQHVTPEQATLLVQVAGGERIAA